MAKFKSLIVSAKLEVVLRKTVCKHDKKHVMTKGEIRMRVKNSTQGESYYCLSCAKIMVTESISKLEELKIECDSLGD
ncbi:TPA: hypothetical protein ACX6RS_001835 [Photobacterium damselae]